ncbi:MAG: cysteine desulfurase / selenocysteine lyase [Parcubacteria group bacterium Gr01-1014_38]|nr:MAG: cysteine desulfurase / selenocysteine lyase [Parcubacteria group bacterium Gr01-1014_38]
MNRDALSSSAKGLARVAARDTSASPPHDKRAADVAGLRAQFPILSRNMRGQPLVYLDNASTTQKPQRVIDAEAQLYETLNANVHRGVYELSEQATEAYVAAHEAVARFINARSAEEIVFVRNATEAINLVASSWGVEHLKRGDQILLTAMEHHSNIVPWQEVARRTGAELRWVECTADGRLDLDDLHSKLTDRVRLVAVTHVSNVLGTVNPIAEIIREAHQVGARVLVDAAQSISRLPIDVQAFDADFLVFSGHKMYGPTGIGVLFGRRELLEAMPPYIRGGDMVKTVTREQATWNDLPWKFEAGTPNIAGGVALEETIRFLSEIGMERLWAHEQALVAHALPRLRNVPGLTVLGPQARVGIFSFTMNSIHSHDLASFLDERGIAVRGGHHCAQPLLTSLGLTECARASVGLYNTAEDLNRLVSALEEAHRLLR